MKKLLIGILACAVILTSGLVFAGEGQFPICYNVPLTLANTQYEQALGRGIKQISVQCRTAVAVRYSYTTGLVAGSTAPYMTMKANDIYNEFTLSTHEDIVIYFATGTAGSVVEILVWR